MDFGSEQMGRWLIVTGVLIALVGVLVLVLGRVGLFKLPGDLQFGGRNWRVLFPLASCVVISIIVTIVLWLVSNLRK
ncbi:MAG: DUF2905 family protein [Phycisphaerales bacterium]|nr:MAG: DUF2905 family protein [Phycisphaerales bacterium]